jgi:Leu/Phe-tRNA-protein transferase
MPLLYTESEHIYIHGGMRPDSIIDAIIETDYQEEICVSLDWNPAFIAELMYAGFLVMSFKAEDTGHYILLPKHHLTRTVIFFDELHIGKTIKRLLPRYELRAGYDINTIIQKCIDVHGDDWLTPPLVECIKIIDKARHSPARPFAFGIFCDGKLAGGEFGIIAGNVYTSYSGYYEENSAGRAQMILTAQYLRDNGFAFWDLGMPLPYKYTLGGRDVNIAEFVRIFRNARTPSRL